MEAFWCAWNFSFASSSSFADFHGTVLSSTNLVSINTDKYHQHRCLVEVIDSIKFTQWVNWTIIFMSVAVPLLGTIEVNPWFECCFNASCSTLSNVFDTADIDLWDNLCQSIRQNRKVNVFCRYYVNKLKCWMFIQIIIQMN